jgi:tetratricopeptide (TPR) repeat protein
MTTGPGSSSPDPTSALRALMERGQFREALEAWSGTADAAVRTRPEVELIAATAATRIGDYGLATTLAEATHDRFRARGDRDGRMRAVNLLGAIAWEQGRLDDAERCFGEALELARALDDTLMAAHASNNLASVAHLRSRPEVALSLYRTALLAYQRLGDRRGTSQTYHNLGLVFREMDDWGDAERAAHEAVRHAEQVGENSLLVLAVSGRAELHIDRGEAVLATRELARATLMAQQVNDTVGQAELKRLEARLALRQSRDAEALALAQTGRRQAAALGITQLEGECIGLEAVALKRLGRRHDADLARIEATALFARLGATGLGARLEQEWAAGPATT